MIDENKIKCFLEDNGFAKAGEYRLNNGEIKFDSLMSEKVNGSYAICVDNIVEYIGNNTNTGKYFNLLCKGDKCSDHTPINDVFRKISESLDLNKQVTAYYVKSYNGDDFLKKYIDVLGEKPEVNKKTKGVKKNGEDRPLSNLSNECRKQIQEAEKKDRKEELERDIQSRNPEVRKKALEASNDRCALCEWWKERKMPECITFFRRSANDKNHYYLEAHHLIPLYLMSAKIDLGLGALNNLDCVENVVCLCSNCHNRIHYGIWEEVIPMLRQLYKQKENDLHNAGIKIDIETIIEIYRNALENNQ